MRRPRFVLSLLALTGAIAPAPPRPRARTRASPRRRSSSAARRRSPAPLRPTLPSLAAPNAYFKYVNSRGGVNGRTITYKTVDDGYDPTRTVQATRQLVEQDKVFAIFNCSAPSTTSPPATT